MLRLLSVSHFQQQHLHMRAVNTHKQKSLKETNEVKNDEVQQRIRGKSKDKKKSRESESNLDK